MVSKKNKNTTGRRNVMNFAEINHATQCSSNDLFDFREFVDNDDAVAIDCYDC